MIRHTVKLGPMRLSVETPERSVWGVAASLVFAAHIVVDLVGAMVCVYFLAAICRALV